MARLDEATADKLRTLTVEVLLEARKAYLQSPSANALKNWDMLTSRIKIATRTATNVEQWITTLLRGLGVIAAPSVDSSRCSLALVGEVRERDVFRQWKHMVETESGLLIAKARLCAEERKEAREAAE